MTLFGGVLHVCGPKVCISKWEMNSCIFLQMRKNSKARLKAVSGHDSQQMRLAIWMHVLYSSTIVSRVINKMQSPVPSAFPVGEGAP